MALRAVDESKSVKVIELYRRVAEGKIPGITPDDIKLVSDPKHLALYQLADIVHAGQNVLECIARGIESTMNSNKGTEPKK
jgi:hypothetical protein